MGAVPKHFAITISSKPRRPTEGAPVRSGLANRLKNAAVAFIVLVAVAAALFVGSILGTAIAMVIGTLVLVAFIVLLVRGTFNRGKTKIR
jgi:hypothetical protein